MTTKQILVAQALKPCPFCGGAAEFERTGTRAHSCIVRCVECGASQESADEYERSGAMWNERAQAAELKDEAMTEERARTILAGSIAEDGGLYSLGHYMCYKPGDEDVCLDCDFTADELEAIAFWMRRATPDGALRGEDG